MWHGRTTVIMSPLLIQILFYVSGTLLLIVAMRYASRPLVHALWHRKMNELPRVTATPKAPISAIPQERKEPAIRPGLLTKTEKVHFIS